MSIAGANTFYWKDVDKGDNVMYRVPRNIRWNDNVVVREDEYAAFFRDGKVLALFDRPGRYAMTTLNVPVLAKLAKAVSGIQQLGEIYYTQRRELRGKFGTPEPFVFRDKDFGLVRIRTFGKFSYKITDPVIFVTEFVGSKKFSTSNEVMDWLRSQIVLCLNDIIGELKRDKGLGVVDMPAYLEEIEQMLLSRVTSDTARYGIKIVKIAGLNINLPEEVKQAVDMKASMGTVNAGYMHYQAGKGMRSATEAGGAGGTAASGMGLGMGAGLGMMMPQMMQQSAKQIPQKTKICPKCKESVPVNAKFCPNCGTKLEKLFCPKCGAEIVPNAKFCLNCGYKLKGKNKK